MHNFVVRKNHLHPYRKAGILYSCRRETRAARSKDRERWETLSLADERPNVLN